MLDFDVPSLLAGLLVSSVGYVLFSYGRKTSRPPHMLGGLLLLIFPYFAPGWAWILGIGALICGLIWAAVQRGY
jgi:hypothetical protein